MKLRSFSLFRSTVIISLSLCLLFFLPLFSQGFYQARAWTRERARVAANRYTAGRAKVKKFNGRWLDERDHSYILCIYVYIYIYIVQVDFSPSPRGYFRKFRGPSSHHESGARVFPTSRISFRTVERITARFHGGSYGRRSSLLQYHAAVFRFFLFFSIFFFFVYAIPPFFSPASVYARRVCITERPFVAF